MNEKWKDWVEKALQNGQQGWQSVQDHITEASSKIGELSSHFSLVGMMHRGDEDKEIIHYFLIPAIAENAPDSLYVIHSFPEGAINPADLKKHRIFHLPDQTAMERMQKMALKNLTASNIPSTIPLSSTETALIELGETIDQTGTHLSGGIFFVGGMLTLVNPIAGAAIIAGSFLPNLGSWMSRKVLGGITGKMSDIRMKKIEKSATVASKREMRQSTCETYINPILQHMARVSSSSPHSADLLEFPLPHHFSQLSWYALTLDAVCQSHPEHPSQQSKSPAMRACLAEATSLRTAWRNTNPIRS